MEKQRAHLGGDEEHSVLVKGLDFALLAKRKAELEREKLEKMDDQLDDLARDIGTKTDKGKQATKDNDDKRAFAGRVGLFPG